MKLILCSNHTLGSYALRAVMWSRYSHAADWRIGDVAPGVH